MLVLSSPDRRSKIGTLILDCLLTEEIDFPSQVTQYPVEDGTTISDHITQGSETIRIGGVMSMTGVAAFSNVAAFTDTGDDPGTKMVEVIETLRKMHQARALVTVSTGQMIYEDMAFTSLNAQRSADGNGGNWLSVKAELVKVRKVTLKTAEVPAEQAAAPASGRAGKTGTPAGRSTANANARPGEQYGPFQLQSGLDRAYTAAGGNPTPTLFGGLRISR